MQEKKHHIKHCTLQISVCYFPPTQNLIVDPKKKLLNLQTCTVLVSQIMCISGNVMFT